MGYFMNGLNEMENKGIEIESFSGFPLRLQPLVLVSEEVVFILQRGGLKTKRCHKKIVIKLKKIPTFVSSLYMQYIQIYYQFRGMAYEKRREAENCNKQQALESVILC